MQQPEPRPGCGDPYRLLGVDTNASRRDITCAYRRAVHDAHPDTQPGDPRAAARFQALTDAYDLLNDPGRRADYDREHPAASPGIGTRWPVTPSQALFPCGRPIWAGPVCIEPPGGQVSRRDPGSPPAADFADPPVILGRRPGRRQGWPW